MGIFNYSLVPTQLQPHALCCDEQGPEGNLTSSKGYGKHAGATIIAAGSTGNASTVIYDGCDCVVLVIITVKE